ncbi:MAG TPA: hypothetical protein VL460_10850 [Caulobacteraceae bacterium]|jgi:hypothetical protein|nr:hypothetical protein [Caulobacteraceae bacterium]
MTASGWKLGALGMAACAAVVFAGTGPAGAETNSAGANLPAKGRYATLEKLPDWSGVWENKSGIHLTDGPGIEKNFPPYNEEWAAKYREVLHQAELGKPVNDPTANCLWPGMPRLMWQPYPFEILFSPGRVTTTHEIYSQVRRIYTDGRKHPADLDPSFNGHSIGHWEGDTLVVDTVGMRGDTMYQNTGMPHSDALHVVERWRLVAPNRLEIEVTMIDPKAFTKPYVSKRYFERHSDWDMLEYVCEENNRNPNIGGVTTAVIK